MVYPAIIIYIYTPTPIYWVSQLFQLFNALRYKPEGRGFDSRWFHLNILSFRTPYGPGIDSVSNRNEYQEYFLGVKVAGRRADNLTTSVC
jgi:hypothetical protein